jgi:hypothetical protein
MLWSCWNASLDANGGGGAGYLFALGFADLASSESRIRSGEGGSGRAVSDELDVN